MDQRRRHPAQSFAHSGESPQDPMPPSVEQVDDEDDIQDEINSILAVLIPWGISLVFHVGLVLLAIFMVWSTITHTEEADVVVPIARLSEVPGAQPTLTTKDRPKRTDVAMSRSKSLNTQRQPSDLNNKVSANATLIGAMGGAAGKASPFGTAIRSGSRFKASMYGSGGNARRIAYIIDASGSLIDSMPFVINELKRSISRLTDQQAFTVIFFQGEDAIEVPPRGLKKANTPTKQNVINWIDLDSGHITPMSQSNPIKAIKVALSYNPNLIFLLSDNITGRREYELNQNRLVTEINKANTANTKINTIQFLYPDPLIQVGLKPTMQLISESNGGLYKFVDGRELGIQ